MRAFFPASPELTTAPRKHGLPFPFVVALLLGLFLTQARADKIFLKSGETLECKVLKETKTSVRVEYRPTPGIIDEKEIPTAEIAKVIKTTPDQEAYEAIKMLFPFPDLMSARDYDQVIQASFTPFLEKFPESDYLEEIEQFLAEAEEERKLVRSGHRKIDGRWYSSAAYKKKSYNLDAWIAHVEIDQLIKDRSYRKALEAFQKLEAEHKGSMAYPEAIVSILGALKAYGGRIDAMIVRQPVLANQRQQGMELIDIRKQAKIKQAIRDEIAQHDTLVRLESEEGRKWKTLYPYDLGGLQRERATIDAELERLGTVNLDILRKSSIHIAAALESFADGEFLQTSAALAKAIQAGADKQLIEKLKEKIAFAEGALEEGIETAARAKAEAAAAVDFVTGDEWGTGGKDAPGSGLMQSRVTVPTDPEGRSALQIKQEDKDKKTAEENAQNAAKKAARAEKIDQKKEQATAVATAAADKAKAAASQAVALTQEEGGGLLSNKLPFILAPLLIVLVAVALNKKKKEDGEDKPKKDKPKKEKPTKDKD